MSMTIEQLARDYHDAVHASAASPVAGEEEAQLTTPVSNLFRGLVRVSDDGILRLIRETRTGRTRPDFAALLVRRGKTLQKGFVELKAPSVSTDASTWKGRNATQWARMKVEADILVVCNGVEARLYREGEPVGLPAGLPYQSADAWDAGPLMGLLRQFLDMKLTPVRSVKDLSRRLAVRTADLRDRLLWLLDTDDAAGRAATGGFQSWRAHIYQHATPRDFADGIAQVVAYGMVLAALSPGGADADDDGQITVGEARAALRGFSPVLAAAFAPLVDKRDLFAAVQVELGALETLISAIDRDAVNVSADRRGEPWLYFYEDFLSHYDPDERRQAGVYYTPLEIVSAMTAMADHLLVERFGRRLGFADAGVVTLDPAAGTGTFPLAVIDRAIRRATGGRGAAGPQQAAINLAANLYAFELLPGAYSVAHLRLSQRLLALSNGAIVTARVVLTDTLESPLAPPDTQGFFGDAETLAAEQAEAARVKLDQRVTVVIGNPPYRRVARDLKGRGSGGWVLDGTVPGRASKKSLFDDILHVANAQTIFSHVASIYNLYVYFWRWAIWKAFEAHGDGPGLVAFITGNSWLTGPGFVGLRQLAREQCDEIWVLDLGGDNRGANVEENVFAIETPVAIVVMARDAASDASRPARVRYRRIGGSREAKLQATAEIGKAADPFAGEWFDASDDWTASFVPVSGDVDWTAMPRIVDLFPWQQPGCKFGRTWPIAPHEDLLSKRWTRFAGASREAKPGLFVTAIAGRNTGTKVGDLPKLIDAKDSDRAMPVVRYGYRSFDRQWAFADPRMTNLERPSLWQSVSSRQVFLCSLLTGQIAAGPALTLSTNVPDLHFFRGNYGGKDIIPLFRDAAATQPNLTAGLADALAEAVTISPPSVEDIAAYVYALLSASAYQSRFAEALVRPGLRVPITADSALWTETVDHGRWLLWLHSYAERLRDPGAGRGRHVPAIEGVGWDVPVTMMPRDAGEIAYNAETHSLSVGDGRVVGVRPDVWAYSVSGMPVMAKWLGYRTVRGAGKAATSKNPLDRIRPESWPDDWNDELLDLIRVLTLTLDRQAALADLLERVCAGPLVAASELPTPANASERQPPAAISAPSFAFD